MPKFVLTVFLILSFLFLLTGGYEALLAFWLVVGLTLGVVLCAVGLDKLVTRRKTVNR